MAQLVSGPIWHILQSSLELPAGKFSGEMPPAKTKLALSKAPGFALDLTRLHIFIHAMFSSNIPHLCTVTALH